MKQDNASKIKLVKILEILRQCSDEKHYVSTPELLGKLSEEGIDCERQTLYNDIDVLNGFGYEILCDKAAGKSNKYRIINRDFELSELRILIDAVQASNFITPKKTGIFIDKITNLGGSHRTELIKDNFISYNSSKHTNEQIYYAVEQIEEAIAENKQISFLYFDYNAKKEKVYRRNMERYIENPYSLIINSDNYYLIVYSEKYGKMINYRVDRMSNLKIEDMNRIFPEIVKEFNLEERQKQVFRMYSGEPTEVTFRFKEDTIDPVIDKFGEDAPFEDGGDGWIILKEKVQVSPQFISWACSFENRLKIVSPTEVIEQIKNHIKEVLKIYSE